MSEEDVNKIIEVYDEVIADLKTENQQLKIQISAREEVANKLENNWNELRKMIEKTIIALHETAINPDDEFITTSKGTFARVLNMMEELEKESDVK